jgi:hypothetical protein
MKHNLTRKQKNRTCITLLFVTLLASFVVVSLPGRVPVVSLTTTSAAANEPNPQAPLRRPWTAVGSSGAVDEDSLRAYAFGSADIGFKPGAPGSIITARYNVTNTFDNNANPNRPGWRLLEMGSKAPNSTIIEAKLFQIKACDTTPVLLCTARNRSNDHPCSTCDFNATIDFTDSLYYVEVTLNRFNSTTANPRMFTLRLF